MKYLGGESSVVRDEFDGLVQINVIGIGAEVVEHGKENHGKRWQPVEASYAALKVRQRQSGHKVTFSQAF
jgi:hypothetical protein